MTSCEQRLPAHQPTFLVGALTTKKNTKQNALSAEEEAFTRYSLFQFVNHEKTKNRLLCLGCFWCMVHRAKKQHSISSAYLA